MAPSWSQPGQVSTGVASQFIDCGVSWSPVLLTLSCLLISSQCSADGCWCLCPALTKPHYCHTVSSRNNQPPVCASGYRQCCLTVTDWTWTLSVACNCVCSFIYSEHRFTCCDQSNVAGLAVLPLLSPHPGVACLGPAGGPHHATNLGHGVGLNRKEAGGPPGGDTACSCTMPSPSHHHTPPHQVNI